MPTLTPLAPGLHALKGSVRPGPGFEMPLHSTVVELETGGLAIVSPQAIDDALATQIEALGPVLHLIAPNGLHHRFLAQAKARWPKARIHGAPGVQQKHPELAFASTLTTGGFLPGLDALAIEGAPAISETVFLHWSSRTLIATDLAFHIAEPRGFFTPLILRSVGAYKKLAQSRYWRFAAKDRAALSRSFRALLDMDFDRLVVAHGEAIESDARGRLLPLLAWALPPDAR